MAVLNGIVHIRLICDLPWPSWSGIVWCSRNLRSSEWQQAKLVLRVSDVLDEMTYILLVVRVVRRVHHPEIVYCGVQSMARDGQVVKVCGS